MTVHELKRDPRYYKHHTACKNGYVSRWGEGEVREYKGRFGEGYILLEPRMDSTRYVWCTYYIKKEGL